MKRVVSSLFLILVLAAPAAGEPAPDYAIVVSEATLADPAWKQVVAALEAKHAARRPFVVSWKVSPDETVPALAERFPRHTCFVARPVEASREFVARVHRLTRRLDDDPYADTLWGILTGFDAAPRDEKGLAFDRDAVAFYGDPAWEARMAPGKLQFDQTLTEQDGVVTLTITPRDGTRSFTPVNTNGTQRGGRPIVAFLPRRLADVEIVAGGEWQPVVTDTFVLVPLPPAERTEPVEVVFRGRPAGPRPDTLRLHTYWIRSSGALSYDN